MSITKRTFDVPSDRAGVADARLIIGTTNGEAATMALLVNGAAVAVGVDFGVAECGRWTWLDMPEREAVETFGAFLSHAVESSEADAREGWPTLTDEAADWLDALTLYAEDEYGTCDLCGDPIDYCQGHGPRAVEVEQSARMVCTVDGVRFEWSGGEYIEVGYVATARGEYEIDYGHAIGAFVAQDCVNVWDHEANAPTIPRTLDAFEARCVEYAQEVER